MVKVVKKYANNNSNIIYFGRQQRAFILEEMSKCKALLFPSYWFEGMPLTIIEALQVGTPVIASNIGVMKEMITHKENGLLFKTNDKVSFLEKIEYWDKLPFAEKEKIYFNAQNSFLKHYTPEKNIETLLSIYNEKKFYNLEKVRVNALSCFF